MCVAILQKPGAIIPAQGLEKGFASNPHGAGFAYVDPAQEKVVIRKGFMTYEDLHTGYYDAVKEFGKDSPFLVHMRIKTSGHINAANTHPFAIKGGAMIHNGSFFHPSKKYAGTEDDLKSDTRVLAENLYNILTYEDVLAAQERILTAVGSYNKLVFLYDDGRYLIMNEKIGFWKDDIWYSNNACTVRG